MAWLHAILEFIGSLKFYAIIEPDEKGVKIRLGRYITTLNNGLYFQWPIIENIYTVTVREQTVRFGQFCVTSKDGCILALGGAVLFEISSAYKSIYHIMDCEQAIADKAKSAASSFVSHLPVKDCTHDAICDEIESEIDSADWGVNVLEILLHDRAKSRVFRVIGDKYEE